MASSDTSGRANDATVRRDPTPAEVAALIERDCARLARDFDGVFEQEAVRRCIEETRRRFESARIRTYLPVLTTKYAREVLRSIAVARGLVPRGSPRVLFVGTDDATATQIAAALLRRAAGDRIVVRTAGIAPARRIPRPVRTVLREAGCDLRGEYPKPLDPRFVEAADVVVTMGCGDGCPTPPGRTVRDWTSALRTGRGVDALRALRDELQTRVAVLLEELADAALPQSADETTRLGTPTPT